MPYSTVTVHDDLTDFFNARNAQLQKYLYWQVKSKEIAEDLAQETYVRFLRQTQGNRIIDLNAFLFTIATNLVRDYQRGLKRQQTREVVALDEEIPDVKPTTEEIVAADCLGAQLEHAIKTLPDKTREIFLLYRADELKYKDIAQKLDISERSVEYHIRQAMLHCRRCLTSA